MAKVKVAGTGVVCLSHLMYFFLREMVITMGKMMVLAVRNMMSDSNKEDGKHDGEVKGELHGVGFLVSTFSNIIKKPCF